jgi:DGQHR domain-containing protein
MNPTSILNEPFEHSLRCLKVRQPIGDFFIASIDCKTLREITFNDVRRMRGDREIETYLGIQRHLDPKRVAEISEYVTTVDAAFPTAVILAIEGKHAEYDESAGTLVLRNFDISEPVADRVYAERTEIARVLDGQHRIEGLKEFSGTFDVNVSVFIDMDIQNQAYVFSTVNLAQTKVNKSLVYDLFEYSKARSPQKTCHNIAVALDRQKDSPFEKRIKRLGAATEGRFGETITQATFVESLLPYITANKILDRDLLLRGKAPAKATSEEARTMIFRNMFLDDRDLDIAEIIFNYFSAVRQRWPRAWIGTGEGHILNKTNGFKALMKVMRPAYRHFTTTNQVVPVASFLNLLSKASLSDDDFTSENFLPGTSGEAKLSRDLLEQMNLPSK